MADKDIVGMLRELEPVVDAVVCTRNSSSRSLSPSDLAARARQVWGTDRVHVAHDVASAIAGARSLAVAGRTSSDGAIILVTGSVVTCGDADRLLGVARQGGAARPEPPPAP